MFIIDNVAALNTELASWRVLNAEIALVPTMGHLHDGHLQLIRAAQKLAQKVVVSIFVNPLQFNDANDLKNYPRTLTTDIAKLRAAGVDLLFAPTVEEMYPNGQQNQTTISVPRCAHMLEGAHRPGHFDGVATVVGKLFNMVAPDFALFGKKDYQQLLLIKTMVSELNFKVQIIAVETERAADGLALSSRNALLSPQQRQVAPLLAQTLQQLAQEIQNGQSIQSAEQRAVAQLHDAGFVCDYVSVCAPDSLQKLSNPQPKMVILAAAKLANVRLIDNLEVELTPPNAH